MMKRSHRRFSVAANFLAALGFIGLLGSAKPAAAQQTALPGWQFYVTPYVWLAGVSGTIQTRNPNIPEQNLQAGFGDVLSHLNAIPIMAALEARNGRFGVMTDIMVISVKAGIPVDNILYRGGSAKLTQVIGSALGTYRVIDTGQQALDMGIGVRAFGMSTNFSLNYGILPGFSIGPGASWADPIFGARYHFAFNPRWGVTAYGDIGGGPDSQFTWQAMGTIDYQVTDSTVMRIGFRHLQFEYQGSRLHQNMAMTGPIIGGTIRF